MDAHEGQGKGFFGRICIVDLTEGRVEFEDLEESFYRKYLSGVGLGAKVLWDRIKPSADPLGPENILGFTTGLLTDTGSVFTGRFIVVGKSPLSRGWGDSNCGGYFSPFLKRCGVDAVFFSGRSEKPVYLYMDGKHAELRDAGDLWGKDAIETEEELRGRHGKSSQVACIGPAGERLSYIAGISTDRGRMAARSGLGAVMGSKKLKAVVAAGKTRVGVADREKIRALSEEFRSKLKRFDSLKPLVGDTFLSLCGKTLGRPLFLRGPAFIWRLMLSKFGTPSFTPMSAESGDSPMKNWAGNVAEDFPARMYGKIGANAVLGYEVKKYGCYSCPLRCGGIVKMSEGPYPIQEMHKPEYETICSFGAMLLNNDLASIFKLNDMVNRAGMDSISFGGVLAFAIECFENGVIGPRDTGGLELKWGDSAAILQLASMIIAREGIGDVLADGVKQAAERIGNAAERFAVHCGGVEAPMHDPKFDPGFGTSHYCEPTPGRHTITSDQYLDVQYLENTFRRAKPMRLLTTRRQKHRYDGRGEALAVGSCYKMLVDAAGVCLFGTQLGAEIPICQWINAATGWDLSNDEYLEIGERIEQLRHAFNVRDGLNPIRDFRPHPRISGDQPHRSGPLKNITLDMDTLARSFYSAMSWDASTGKTDLQRLRRLGLDDVIAVLYPDTCPESE